MIPMHTTAPAYTITCAQVQPASTTRLPIGRYGDDTSLTREVSAPNPAPSARAPTGPFMNFTSRTIVMKINSC